jgi:peroxiredoxin
MNVQLLSLVLTLTISVQASRPSEPVANFNLIDQHGRAHELYRQQGRAVLLFFTANGCPVARQSALKLREIWDQYHPRGLDLFLVNSSAGDDRMAMGKEAAELGINRLNILKDDTQGLARHLKVYRTCEAILIRTADWTVAYRGALDDQFVEGAGKPEASQQYLRDAIEALLSDKPIRVSQTVSRGCRIHFEALAGRADEPVSYVREVAPILQNKCLSCHSPGNIGSWAMSNHRRVGGMAAMIEEVLLTRRMPPWDADPVIGKFKNDSSLSLAEARTLLLWIEQGAKLDEENGPDPLAAIEHAPPPQWPRGTPDIVLKLPEPQLIPATGVLPYRHVAVAVHNAQDLWVRGIYIKPGNRRVVHHVILRLQEGGHRAGMLAGWAPGSTQAFYPENSGKFIPQNATLEFELHYTTTGSEQTDQTEIGLYLHPGTPAAKYESFPILNLDFEIPPHAPNSLVHAHRHFTRGATLYSVVPHMHVRGKWASFELLFPDGTRQMICSVPRYDFNWQTTYILEEPIRVPPGTWGLMTGGFDNSAANPANPDPARRVSWGDQSWEEMFIGWFNVVWDPEEPRTAALPLPLGE